MMRALAVLSVLSCFLVAAFGEKAFSSEHSFMAHDAWAPPSLDGATVATGFSTLMNHSDHAIEIASLSSEIAATVELHDHVMEDGKMRMRRVSPIVIAAQESIVMKPGGYHLMLIDLKQPLKDGEKFTVQIGLKDGQTTSVDFVVSQARLLEALKSRTHSAHEH